MHIGKYDHCLVVNDFKLEQYSKRFGFWNVSSVLEVTTHDVMPLTAFHFNCKAITSLIIVIKQLCDSVNAGDAKIYKRWQWNMEESFDE